MVKSPSRHTTGARTVSHALTGRRGLTRRASTVRPGQECSGRGRACRYGAGREGSTMKHRYILAIVVTADTNAFAAEYNMEHLDAITVTSAMRGDLKGWIERMAEELANTGAASSYLTVGRADITETSV